MQHVPATDHESLLREADQFRRARAWDQALRCAEAALGLAPSPRAHAARALALLALGRAPDALASIDAALLREPSEPQWHVNRALVLRALERLEEALIGCDRALALLPHMGAALNVRGLVLGELGLPQAALENFRLALAMAPGDAELHWHLSLRELQLGNFAAGWAAYEWRWRLPGLGLHPPAHAQPRWTGAEPIAGRTLLLEHEQGLGDTIQFTRYVPLLAERGAKVILRVPPQLQDLLGTVRGVHRTVSLSAALPAFDTWAPVASLPLALRLGADSPAWRGPYVGASQQGLDRWRRRLGPRQALRVVLVWSGNPQHRRDARRSIPVQQLLAALPAGPQYLSVQPQLREGEALALRRREDVLHLGGEIRDFSDTAALCCLADLVVTVDTSVAHLAGALGCRLLVLLPFDADWRWLMHRADSPWYPTATLLRQSRPGRWSDVLRQLAEMLGDPGRPGTSPIVP
ncbi:MAG TPA: tetratricopeptide repeat-containing glycosyltransferase family protein [Ramlibacter sp.]|nr:tetratricopeptide repeat-containing glycosyltransferase family protein [Ramlibacter sp.]